jgi:virginiamycin B lyase
MPLMPFDGSDWSMGTPSRYVGRAAHDVWVDKQGMVWMADDMVPERTLAKLDPLTGKVTNYVRKDAKGLSISTHSVVVDDRSGAGLVWATDGNDDSFIAFDPTSEVFKTFPRPAGMRQSVGGTLDVDSQGNPWAVSQSGALKLEVRGEKYTFYPAPKEGGTYGITIDREDNAWYTQPGNETVVKVDAKAGTSTAVVLEPLVMPEILPVDRERAQQFRANQNIAPPQQKAPRRTAADPNGDYVWTAEYTGDRLLRINIKTNETKEYPLPHAYSQPYATAVDKNGNVWMNTINLDRIVKFDPKTERFTEYQLPTRGTEIRHIQVDNRTDPPTIWAPYNRVNKIVRLQFRTAGS